MLFSYIEQILSYTNGYQADFLDEVIFECSIILDEMRKEEADLLYLFGYEIKFSPV